MFLKICLAIGACNSTFCLNNGTCTSIGLSSYMCTCPPSFTGLRCDLSKSISIIMQALFWNQMKISCTYIMIIMPIFNVFINCAIAFVCFVTGLDDFICLTVFQYASMYLYVVACIHLSIKMCLFSCMYVLHMLIFCVYTWLCILKMYFNDNFSENKRSFFRRQAIVIVVRNNTLLFGNIII